MDETVVQSVLPLMPTPTAELVALAVALGARRIPEWTEAEEALARRITEPDDCIVAAARDAIDLGQDPLGDTFCRIFSNEDRRPKGATYTPQPIIDVMLDWAEARVVPCRIVDPGAGSGRFLVAAGRRFPHAELLAIEVDPLAAILARGHLAAAGLADRARVILDDYRAHVFSQIEGPTLFLGNPPYVRHHLIDERWKCWLTNTARQLGFRTSQLAGLHVHFFLATAIHGRPGDVGILITAAEWLDVNYGRLVRELLLGVLGAEDIHIVEPTVDPFPGTQTTAVITGFKIGQRNDTIGVRRVSSLDELRPLHADRRVGREQLATADRWSPLTRRGGTPPDGYVALGELCRVHRGQVTGANDVWIADGNPFDLPEDVFFPSVTKARELFAADGALTDLSKLRRVIDLPIDLDSFDRSVRKKIDRFLAYAEAKGAREGYIARNRKAWWSVGLREPAPILASYMARRPPVFVRNLAGARHINIAHGLYPRVPLTEAQLRALAAYLTCNVKLAEGRTYAGGLTKFEPREMERVLVPSPDLLAHDAPERSAG
jgi:adenine-specific DNA-methyltransferase